jgi:hypothetical protein
MGKEYTTERQIGGLIGGTATYTVTETETGKEGHVTVWSGKHELEDVGRAISQGKIQDNS